MKSPWSIPVRLSLSIDKSSTFYFRMYGSSECHEMGGLEH